MQNTNSETKGDRNPVTNASRQQIAKTNSGFPEDNHTKGSAATQKQAHSKKARDMAQKKSPRPGRYGLDYLL
jgi:hypothetical protein